MKHYKLTLDNQTFDVEVLDDPRQGTVRVKVDGETFTVDAETVVEAAAAVSASAAPVVTTVAPVSAAAPAPVAAAAGAVKSPLPGVVRSIKVKSGQTVAFNDELCVIEAMKAMNVIRAPRAGKVGQIYVTEGKQIPHGAALMDLE